jgi:hypothetical protein
MSLNIAGVIFYLAICIAGFVYSIKNIEEFKGALSEKGPGTEGGGASFSRVAGALGAFMLTAFMMVFGAYAILQFGEKDGAEMIGKWFEAIKHYLYVCAALFAPYASNQLSKLFSGAIQMNNRTAPLNIARESAIIRNTYDPNYDR